MTPRHAPTPLLMLAALVTALVGAPHDAVAQFRVGAHVAYGNSSGIDPGLGLGLRGTFGLGLADAEGDAQTASGAIAAVVSLERFFPDCDPLDCGLWELNGNVVLPLFATRGFTPYLGAGLGLSRLSVDEDSSVDGGAVTDTEAGVNLLGGVRYRGTRLTTFGELRQNIGGGEDPFYVTVGVLFGG